MVYVLSIVLLLPPAPAALVLVGLALATLSALSAAAFLRIAVFGPPGGVGDDGCAVFEPAVCAELTGELGRGEDWVICGQHGRVVFSSCASSNDMACNDSAPAQLHQQQ